MKQTTTDILFFSFIIIFLVLTMGYISHVAHEQEREIIQLREELRITRNIVQADYSYRLYINDTGIEVYDSRELITVLDSINTGLLYSILLKDNE